MTRARSLLFIVAAGLAGCPTPEPVDGGPDDSGTRDTPVTSDAADGGGSVLLAGTVEKGPFVTGSSVRVGLLDAATLAPIGMTFDTSTLSDLGDWELLLPTAAPIQIEGDGFYYNEALGALSSSRIVLRALYVPTATATQTAYVNMVTHLTHDRVRTLVRDGATFEDAVRQAEDELRAQLGITVPGFDPGRRGVELSLAGGDDDANAYLFAVSTVLAYTARARPSGSADANLQELTNTITLDLRDGTIDAARLTEIHAALSTFRTSEVEQRFATRLAAIGSSATPPDLDRVLDQDRDGLVNASDNCAVDANTDQSDGDGDGIGDACDVCPATACPEECIPASEFGSDADLCVEECGDGDPCTAAADTCTWSLEMTAADACSVQRRVCAAPCDPSDPDACGARETCDVITTSEAGSGAVPSQWACVPATVGAGPGTPCATAGAIGVGCGHGLVCDGGSAFGEYVAAWCLSPRSGICRAPCGVAALPACDAGAACGPRTWDTTSAYRFAPPSLDVPVCATPGLLAIPEGGSCDASRDACAPGVVCISGAHRCERPRDVGASCSRDLECEAGLVCFASGGLCGAPVGLGERCGRRIECEAGLGCALSTATCVVARALGETCGFSDECASGLICSTEGLCEMS